MKRTFLGAILVGSCLLSARGDTVNITIPNFSFELNPSSTNTVVYSGGGGGDHVVNGGNPYALQDWTFQQGNDSQYGTVNYASSGAYTGGTGSQGAFIASDYGYYQVALFSGNVSNNDGTTAGSNGIVAMIDPNATSYTLSVDVASPASAAIPPDTGWTGYFTLALIDSTTGSTLASKDIGYLAFTPAMQTETVTFTPTLAQIGDGMKIELSLINSPFNDVVALDNVTLTENAVPEPSTWAMMILGAGGLVFLVRRRLVL